MENIMFTRNTEADKRVQQKVYRLWRKVLAKELSENSERIYQGLNLSNPHGYETRNELDD